MRYPCDKCSYAATCKNYLKTHIKIKHPLSYPAKEENISRDSNKIGSPEDLVLKKEDPIAEFVDTSNISEVEIKTENISKDGPLPDTIAELMDQDPLKVPECLVNEELKEEIDIKEEIF